MCAWSADDVTSVEGVKSRDARRVQGVCVKSLRIKCNVCVRVRAFIYEPINLGHHVNCVEYVARLRK